MMKRPRDLNSVKIIDVGLAVKVDMDDTDDKHRGLKKPADDEMIKGTPEYMVGRTPFVVLLVVFPSSSSSSSRRERVVDECAVARVLLLLLLLLLLFLFLLLLLLPLLPLF
jgi:hypothetical protein